MAVLNQSVLAISSSIANNGTFTVQPPSGEEWMITSLGSQAPTGSGTGGIYNTAYVYLSNGTTDVMLRKGDSTVSAYTAQWGKPMRFGLTNTNYLKIKNVGGVSLRYYHGGRVTGVGTAGIGDIKSGISTSIAAGAAMTIQPPSGQEWVLWEVGIAEAGWADNGGSQRYAPKVRLVITDGTNEVEIAQGSDFSIFQPFRVVFNNSTYIKLYNTDSSARDMGYIAQRIV